jgi:hypothetical protein
MILDNQLILVTGKSGTVSPLIKKANGYQIPVNGLLPSIQYHTESHGVWCQNVGYLGSFFFYFIDFQVCVLHRCKKMRRRWRA